IDITKKAIEASPFKKEDIDEIILVGGQTRMPKITERVKEYFGKEANKSINPDEVVALGAAVQAGIFQGDAQDVLLLDVTPLSLGIETMGGVFTELIEANTTIPTSRSKTFSTAQDNQTSVEIHVLQGERSMAADNKSLGRFVLDGIPPAPRGTPQVEVEFDLDANGILHVSAKDKNSGKEQSIKIEANSDLSDEDIEKMKQDAEAHAEEDKQKKELIDTKNQAEQIVFTAEDALKENKEAIDDSVAEEIEADIKNLKEKKESDNTEEIKAATEKLSKSMQKIGEAMAKQAQEKQDSENKEDNVRDAEVEDEDQGDESEKEE
ncbi:MAG: Hsp70 family protein, partial [Candidatus Paceibacterota bacterium]